MTPQRQGTSSARLTSIWLLTRAGQRPRQTLIRLLDPDDTLRDLTHAIRPSLRRALDSRPGVEPDGLRRATPQPSRQYPTKNPPAPYQSEVDEGFGAAVAILIDTSRLDARRGARRLAAESRRRTGGARGDVRRHRVAGREAPRLRGQGWHLQLFERRLDRAADAAVRSRRHPRRARARAPALAAAPPLARPCSRRGPTCIVQACSASICWSSRTGRTRPAEARTRWRSEIFQKSEQAVAIYFVAFDTSADRFAFLKQVQGDVIGAGSGPELRKALDEIYQGRILAEASTLGEREPDSR